MSDSLADDYANGPAITSRDLLRLRADRDRLAAQIKALDTALRDHYIVARDGIRPICKCAWNAPQGATTWEWTRHRLDKIIEAINNAGKD